VGFSPHRLDYKYHEKRIEIYQSLRYALPVFIKFWKVTKHEMYHHRFGRARIVLVPELQARSENWPD